MSVLQRARDSGKCPPSLLSEEHAINEDGFDEAVLKVLDASDFVLASDPQTADNMTSLLQKIESFEQIPAASDELKNAALEQRRSIVLALVGATPESSPSLERVLANGYLTSVKLWLDEALSGTVGGLDFLLHLLSSIINLPVTKSEVKSSGMGKAVGTIEKHSICVGTPNESAIKDRTRQIKDAWNASVKARKSKDTAGDTKASAKRPLDAPSPSTAKRIKVVDTKKSSSFTNLLKKVSSASTTSGAGAKAAESAESSSAVGQDGTGTAAENGSSVEGSSEGMQTSPAKNASKKSAQRVKWVDHFGGSLSVAKHVEGGDAVDGGKAVDTSVSWSDRKKRDRMREKELLAKAKKAKLLDDDEEEPLDTRPAMKTTTEWRAPTVLPNRTDVTPAQLVSSEIAVQNERSKTISPAHYFAEYDVPNSPAPLSDVEQALDMTSQSSTVVAAIPFFVPQQPEATPAPAPAAATAAATAYSSASQVPSNGLGSTVSANMDIAATPEFVQSLGLPMFLVGQSVQALQTLASSPGLLSTLVDSNGMYDEPRLLSLVQTLSGSQGQSQAPAYAAAPSSYSSASASTYGSGVASSPYGPPRNGFRGSSSEGNLHISGYGPTTTQSDIIALFSPYVIVDEVVMKGTFAFVNTSDPVNAQKAREILNGSIVGGMPVRINPATRKSRDASSGSAYGPASAAPSFGGSSFGGGPAAPSPHGQQAGMPPMMQNGTGQVDIDSVRDDRGNPATKNLFVAGYGPGTTEAQLREIFGQFATVIGVVNKGTFSFVNTSDRAQAVLARERLGGSMLNGSAMRINFAKETGRLGTSFDVTYNVNTGPNAGRGGPVGPGPGGPRGNVPAYYGPGRGY